jgi:protein-S-isoprenylcysteine O-methyltransferase Ste14
VVTYEEPILRKQFGEGYDRYRASVPRWIPRIRL